MSLEDKNKEIFPILEGDDLFIPREYDDDIFFEEALSKSTSANDPNKTFSGSVINKKRFTISMTVLSIICCFFISKTAYLQIINGEYYRDLAEENRIHHFTLPSQRGIIYDINGTVLAENTPIFNVIIPAYIIQNHEYTDQVNNIAKILEVDLLALTEQVSDINYNKDILFAERVEYEKALQLISISNQFTWLSIEVSSLRSYITDEIPSLSHVLGYTSKISEQEYEALSKKGYRGFDYIGQQGIEKKYEESLRGQYGEELIEVDASGNIERIISKADSINGENIVLTIDSSLQSYVETVLTERMNGTSASRASVIIMNPNNGEIQSLVSWPAYDSNLFSEGIAEEQYIDLINDEDTPLFPRAISGEFPSGSTIKPVFAAAALIQGIITESTTFLSTGGISVSIWFFPDWKAGGHGITDVYHAIADSVNTFFYIIGGGNETFDGLGIEKMMEYAALFGFGNQTGIDLPGEADGFLPSKEWKQEVKGEPWYIGDTYHVAIGQGDLLVTPMQIASSTAVFANNGHMITPHINSALNFEPKKIIDDSTAQIIKDAMRRTITTGSAQILQSAPVQVCGKTGTAQWSTTGIPHSWFTGFAPYDNPEVVVTVLIEEGGDDYIAAPVALDILNYIYSN